MNPIEKEILEVKLIKVEKSFRAGSTPIYYYNFILEGFDEPLLVPLDHQLEPGLVGNKISYYLNEEYEVSEFTIV
jgi:hypothetical protein